MDKNYVYCEYMNSILTLKLKEKLSNSRIISFSATLRITALVCSRERERERETMGCLVYKYKFFHSAHYRGIYIYKENNYRKYICMCSTKPS